MEKKRLTYEPPQARDLSTPSVSGQGPLYPCISGLIATPEGCTQGASPNPGPCALGMFDGGPLPPCTTGGGPPSGECVTGGDPGAGGSCLSGFTV
jgi:hypothetical protein